MIIVTGGAGFIGSNLVRELNARGETDILIVDELGETEKWKNLVGLSYEDYIDKEVTIVDGFSEADPSRGRVSYRGADWNARSAQGPFANGAIAKITGREGNTLLVEPITSEQGQG